MVEVVMLSAKTDLQRQWIIKIILILKSRAKAVEVKNCVQYELGSVFKIGHRWKVLGVCFQIFYSTWRQ